MAFIAANDGHQAASQAAQHPSGAADYVHMAMDMTAHSPAGAVNPDHGLGDAGTGDHGAGHDVDAPIAAQHEGGHGFGAPGAAEHDVHGFAASGRAEDGLGRGSDAPDGAGHGAGYGFGASGAPDHEVHGFGAADTDGDGGGHGFDAPGIAVQGMDHTTIHPGAPERGIDPAEATPMNPAAHHSPAGEYMAFVQPEAGHQATSQLAAEGSPGAAEHLQLTADTMAHAQQGPQEPPPPDHLFADAQIDHGSAHGAGSETHDATLRADVSGAVTAPEPLPVEPHDHGHGG
jgi:hypothetical protein